MEPNLNMPRNSGEQYPSLPTPQLENVPGQAAAERAPEQGPSGFEREPIVSQQSPAYVPVPVLPQPVQQVAEDTAQAQVVTNMPATAADDDLIEKEWVDKAKKIIADTADDPHRREEAISQLQRDYLRKRYGKELGVADGSV